MRPLVWMSKWAALPPPELTNLQILHRAVDTRMAPILWAQDATEGYLPPRGIIVKKWGQRFGVLVGVGQGSTKFA